MKTANSEGVKIKKSPIGYYLRRLDNLLTTGINEIHNEFGINRSEWQMLNLIHENPNIDKQTLFEPLLEFSDIDSLENKLNNFALNQLISDKINICLTNKGEDFYSKCLQKQLAFRKKSMKGISEDDYNKTISVLEKVINNLT